MTIQTMDPTMTTDAIAADYAPMAGYIAEATAAWWAYLTGDEADTYRERFATETARGLVQDVYAHEVEGGATEAAAVAAAGLLLVRSTISAVTDEQADRLAAGLRDHVHQSVTQG
ncbi:MULTISPECIES: hypothetical protein [unclassified Streptomyces]|uniref:hypothetical protein n=1 Tax=unclassified Streptomyces TaxID=2593676 RepID=UPI0033B684F6